MLISDATNLKEHVGKKILFEGEFTFTKADLCAFLELSKDSTPLHDPKINAAPVVPGNMLIMKIPFILQRLLKVRNYKSVMTIGYSKVSFKSPIVVGDQLKAFVTLSKVKILGGKLYLNQKVNFYRRDNQISVLECEVMDMYDL